MFSLSGLSCTKLQKSKVQSNRSKEDSCGVEVHKHTENPDIAWQQLRKRGCIREPINTLPLDTPVAADKVRFVCISDTHNRLSHVIHKIPDGDVLLHAGDFTGVGTTEEVVKFNDTLSHLPHLHKLVISGNHELSFDKENARQSFARKRYLADGYDDESTNPRLLLTNCTYLEDTSVEVFGIKVYGSPWQPEFSGWAFNVERGESLLAVWNRIPDDTDVLITHGPPVGHGDVVTRMGNKHVGCVELLSTIEQRVRPRYHVFGHIHEDYGVTTNGATTFINASICDTAYRPVNSPIIFDIPLPPDVSKASFLNSIDRDDATEQTQLEPGASML